jgi:hypothetical protein
VPVLRVVDGANRKLAQTVCHGLYLALGITQTKLTPVCDICDKRIFGHGLLDRSGQATL